MGNLLKAGRILLNSAIIVYSLDEFTHWNEHSELNSKQSVRLVCFPCRIIYLCFFDPTIPINGPEILGGLRRSCKECKSIQSSVSCKLNVM